MCYDFTSIISVPILAIITFRRSKTNRKFTRIGDMDAAKSKELSREFRDLAMKDNDGDGQTGKQGNKASLVVG